MDYDGISNPALRYALKRIVGHYGFVKKRRESDELDAISDLSPDNFRAGVTQPSSSNDMPKRSASMEGISKCVTASSRVSSSGPDWSSPSSPEPPSRPPSRPPCRQRRRASPSSTTGRSRMAASTKVPPSASSAPRRSSASGSASGSSRPARTPRNRCGPMPAPGSTISSPSVSPTPKRSRRSRPSSPTAGSP